MKIDPYKNKETYFIWKEKTKDGILEISKENSDLIKRYIENMEQGVNVASVSVKGARSYIRLNSLKQRMI